MCIIMIKLSYYYVYHFLYLSKTSIAIYNVITKLSNFQTNMYVCMGSVHMFYRGKLSPQKRMFKNNKVAIQLIRVFTRILRKCKMTIYFWERTIPGKIPSRSR